MYSLVYCVPDIRIQNKLKLNRIIIYVPQKRWLYERHKNWLQYIIFNGVLNFCKKIKMSQLFLQNLDKSITTKLIYCCSFYVPTSSITTKILLYFYRSYIYLVHFLLLYFWCHLVSYIFYQFTRKPCVCSDFDYKIGFHWKLY